MYSNKKVIGVILLGNLSSVEKIDWTKFKQEYVVDNLNDEYMFDSQIKKIKDLIVRNTSFYRNPCEENAGKFNRLVGVTGERGSGKSSLLKTLKNDLDKNREYEDFYVLPIIDPNKLDHQMGILEIILSTLYLEVEKKRRDTCVSSNHFNEVSRKIINQLGIVSKLAISKSDFRKHFSNEEILSQYHKQLLFEDNFHDLFSEVWSLLKGRSKEQYKRGYLIVLIDDIDLVGNDLVYIMLEDIKRVLSNNVTTIVTYRYTQLLNSIYDSKIRENENLLKHNIIDNEEIRLRTSTYIEKMFLQNHIVKMPVKEEVIYNPLKKILNNLFGEKEKEIMIYNGFDSEKTIIQNIYSVFKKKTLIDFYSLDINERALYESGLTLRGIVQILEFLCDDLLLLENKIVKTDLKNNLEDNLKKTKKYFWGIAEQILDFDQKHILEKWDLVDSQSKNYIIYKELYYMLIKENGCNTVEDEEEPINNLLATNRVEAYNVCLGDIVQILNVFKDSAKANLTKYHFIYTIKIFYSIELLDSLVTEFFIEQDSKTKLRFDLIEKNSNIYFGMKESDDKTNIYWTTRYYNLTRYKILPVDVSFFSKSMHELNVLYPGASNSRYSIENFEKANNKKTMERILNDKEKNNSLGLEEKMRFFDKIFYTPVSSYGDINVSRFKINQLGSKSHLTKKDPHSLRYRHYFLFRFNNNSKLHESDKFNINEVTSLKKNIVYPFDPYSYLVKEQYLSKSIDDYKYLFYSLFDIDLILTKNHDNKKNTPYSDLFSSVNNIFDKILCNKYNLADFLVSESNEVQKYLDLYSKNEINYLIELKASEEGLLNEFGRKILRLYDKKDALNGSSKERKEDFVNFVKSSRYVSPTNKSIILDMENKRSNTPNIDEKNAMKKIIDDMKNRKIYNEDVDDVNVNKSDEDSFNQSNPNEDDLED